MNAEFSFKPSKNRQGYVISIMVDDPTSWILPWAERLIKILRPYHKVSLVFEEAKLVEGDMAVLLGCTKIMPAASLSKNKLNLVVHESDLPSGRGWSPVAWQILEGKNEIPVLLFEATPELDAGPIYLHKVIYLDGTELLPEIKDKQGAATLKIICEFLEKWPEIQPQEQTGHPSYYPQRTIEHDKLEPHKTIAEQFDHLRIVDNEKYPAWFEFRNRKYRIKIYPVD
jgi:methionyl-tRNA formyltransferase